MADVRDEQTDTVVKAASTPAAATDPALVVAISPNNNVSVSGVAATVPAATTMQNAATALGNGTTLNVQGYSVAVLVVTITNTANVLFEVSQDNSVWETISVVGIDGGGVTNGSAISGIYRCNVAGFVSLRARISSYTSGTVTVKGYTSVSGTDSVYLASTLLVATHGVTQSGSWTVGVATQVGAANMANGQVAISTAATLVASRATRRYVVIRNLDSTVVGWVGIATVTAGNGMRVDPGESIVLHTTALVQGFAASSITFSWIEIYD